MEQTKLMFKQAIVYFVSALIVLLSIGPLAPKVSVQEPVTSQSRTIIYEVRAIALMSEPSNFRLEEKKGDEWICLEIRPNYVVYGYGIRTIPMFEPYRNSIPLEAAFGHLLECGCYRLTIFQSLNYCEVGKAYFEITE